MRITARYLLVDHTRISVGFRTVADGMCVISADPNEPTRAQVWAVLELDEPTSPEHAQQLVAAALSS